MQIIVTINIPDEQLAARLAGERMTTSEFKEQMRKAFVEDLAPDGICPGATTTIEFR